jgi:signal peptidase I
MDSRYARRGFWAAVVLGVCGLIAMWVNPVVAALTAVLFFAIAWGIRRGQAWAAIAGVWFTAYPLFLAVYNWKRVAGPSLAGAIVALMIEAFCAYLFLRAAIALLPRAHSSRFAPVWIGVMATFMATTFALRPYYMPSASMENAILAGDSLFLETASWRIGRTPRFGDVIAFRYPVDRAQVFIKRVAGIPGDRLRIVDKQLYRNGASVAEPYAIHTTVYVDSYRDNFPSTPNAHLPETGAAMLRDCVRGDVVIVPEGKYFVLGDNRDNSLDSRYWGFVDRPDIIGSPVIVYGSYELTGEPESSPRAVRNLRWNRLLKPL